MNTISGFSPSPYFGSAERKAALGKLKTATAQRTTNLDRLARDEYTPLPGEPQETSDARRETYKKLIINSQHNTTRTSQ